MVGPAIYWSGTAVDGDNAFGFNFTSGEEGDYYKDSGNYYAMAVHEGNVGVPDGGLTAMLLGAGVLALAGVRRLVK